MRLRPRLCGYGRRLGRNRTVRNLLLPFGSPGAQPITVQARDFGVEVPIRVTLTPDNGASSSVDATIDNLSANPASVTVPVEIPANVNTAIHVWTR